MNFPVTYIKNFFNYPDKILKYANTVDYFPPTTSDSWKGLRSKPLNEINPDLFHHIINKVLSTYYDFNLETVSWDKTYAAFHKMNNINITKKDIHTDEDSELAGIIYLNKNGDINNGTTIYNNEKEIIKVANEYNSMVCYDSKFRHCASNCVGERFNIVFFIDILQVKQLPLDRFRRVNLIDEF
tara:strand:+ start:111 stop:662 length:552 start_codon:yes stop_codon:yes gene_type:complete